ncbi:GNAT family N-acetyltransferase [uncultured Tateyamaria sp.]|uniref:GNAT family N-acetyltransferase n=1 Tax=uncultured Tateyamaria sp. TaxID=455651 RepID=UPI00260F36D5|nr:GNAT family N-acetyltransferase [uncultured Tateyamaria sp.]
MTFDIVTDVERFDFDQIVPAVQSSYWGQGRQADDILLAFAGSAVVGVFEDGQQVAVARAITDGVYHAYIYDLIVFEPHRGRGLAHVLMDALFAHPQLKAVSGWMLSTRDAHGLYEKYGFAPTDPNRTMWMRRAQT